MSVHTGLPRGPEGTIYEEKGFADNLRIEIDKDQVHQRAEKIRGIVDIPCEL